MSKESEVVPIKIVLVGESETGKTNIVTQYVSKKFSFDTNTTITAGVLTKTIELEEYSSSLRLQVWDTAGQEKFRSLARQFYTNASAVILVYDITNQKSFEEIKKYWCNEVKDKAPQGFILGLAANKSDLILEAKVTEDEGRQYAKSIGAIFRNTSAFSADGIDDLFETVCRKVLDPNYKEDEEKISNVKKTIDPRISFLPLQKETVKLDIDKANNQTTCCSSIFGGGN